MLVADRRSLITDDNFGFPSPGRCRPQLCPVGCGVPLRRSRLSCSAICCSPAPELPDALVPSAEVAQTFQGSERVGPARFRLPSVPTRPPACSSLGAGAATAPGRSHCSGPAPRERARARAQPNHGAGRGSGCAGARSQPNQGSGTSLQAGRSRRSRRTHLSAAEAAAGPAPPPPPPLTPPSSPPSPGLPAGARCARARPLDREPIGRRARDQPSGFGGDWLAAPSIRDLASRLQGGPLWLASAGHREEIGSGGASGTGPGRVLRWPPGGFKGAAPQGRPRWAPGPHHRPGENGHGSWGPGSLALQHLLSSPSIVRAPKGGLQSFYLQSFYLQSFCRVFVIAIFLKFFF